MHTANRHRRTSAGFTLLEVMITVAIVGILASIALPSYNYFITRSRLVEGTNALADMRSQMEKWFMDHRDYTDGAGKCGIEAPVPNLIATYNGVSGNKFVMKCQAVSASTYALRAVGSGPVAGFTYEVNEQNAKKTVAVPGGWTLPGGSDCWVIRKDGTCS